MTTTALLRVGAGVAALTMSAGTAAVAFEDNATTFRLEEIVVTSQRTSETALQSTPLSISAFSSKSLESMKFETVRDIERLSPSLSISNNNNAAQIYVRGVGTNLVFPGSDPSVAVFVDGVYYSNPRGLLTDFIGVERIEVLKGPQGTLYGRNAAGGVISIITKKPDNELHARLAVEYGSYDRQRFSAYISGPIIEDKLAANLTAMQAKRDGYTKNIYQNPALPGCQCQGDQPPRRFNGEDFQSARGSLRYTPTDDLEIIVRGDYYKNDGPTFYKTLYVNDLGNDLRGAVYGPLGSPLVIEDPFTVASNIANQYNKLEIYGFSGHITKSFSNGFSVTSITAYRDLTSDFRSDTDNTDISTLVSNVAVWQNQFSQEFQLNWKTDAFDFIAGIYYFNETNKQDAIIELPLSGILAFDDDTFASPLLAISKTDAYATFAQGTYNVTDRLRLTGGLRYSYEKKDIFKYGTLTLQGVTLFPFVDVEEDDSWKALTPRFGIDYSLSDDVMVFANVTRGFKSGGYNFSDSKPAFDPEFLWAYEVGLKSDWFDNRLRANLSAFYYDYQDLQAQAFIITPTGAGAGVAIFNAADAKVKGVELELTARPVRQLTLTGGITYLDATYKEFITARTSGPDAGVPVDVAGNHLNNAPKWKFDLTAQYEEQIEGLGIVSLRGEYSWRDDIYFTFFNDQSNSQSSYGTVNAFLSLGNEEGRWKVTVYGRNLTDKLYYTSTQNFAETGVAGGPGAPRTFGILGEVTF